MGTLALQRLQIGAESTAGTAVAATTKWRGEGGMLKDARTVTRAPELVGIAVPTNRIYIPKLYGQLSMAATVATFEQLPYLLEAGIKLETPAADGVGTDFIYEYEVGNTAINTVRTYTIESGDETQAEEMEYGFVEDFTISGKFGESLMMSGNWGGRQVANTTFTGALSIPTAEAILGGNGTISIDPVSGAYGGNAVTAGSIYDFTLKVTTGWRAKFTIDNSNLYFHSLVFNRKAFAVDLSMTLSHVSGMVTEKGHFRTGTRRLFRLLFDGAAVATPGTTYSNKTLIIDVAGYYESFDALQDEDGDSTMQATIKGGYDETDATSLKFTVVNELSALP